MAPTGLRQARELTTSLQPCASGSRQQLRHRTGSLHHSQCACGTCHRKYSSGAPTDAAWVAKEVEEINTLFVEARDEIDYAKEGEWWSYSTALLQHVAAGTLSLTSAPACCFPLHAPRSSRSDSETVRAASTCSGLQEPRARYVA